MPTPSTLRARRTLLERRWSAWVASRTPAEPRVGSAGAGPLDLGPLDLGGPALATPDLGTPDLGLQDEVTASWARSLATVDPGTDAAPAIRSTEVRDRWHESPMRQPIRELADELRAIADDADLIAAVTDESGAILWTCGGRVMRQRAERVNFAPGGCWSEASMGTNALSLALRTDRPNTVFSAEHLVHALHGWVCYCAPIHDPAGRVLGVLDLSTTWDRSHPLAMSTVRALVTTIEAKVADRAGPAPTGLRLACLGPGRAVRDGRALPLRPRELEILTLLALHPDGLTFDQTREALFGDRNVSTTTLKAQVSRLRTALDGALATRRYLLTEPVACDAVAVLRALRAGDTAAAVRRYTGELLPWSTAPGIEVWRDHLAVAVREAVLGSPDPDHALQFGERHPYDLQVHEHACALLPTSDPRRGIALARLRATAD